jgi:3-hydroxyacyl-CoA dehydrogenase
MLSDARTVALVGAGTIGASWSVVYTRAGLETRVFDTDPAQRATVPERFDTYAAQLVEAGLVDEIAAGEMRMRLSVHDDLEAAIEGADYVQESVPEDIDVKRAVFGRLDAMTPPEVILGSSVSALPLSDITRALAHPERCVGVHPTNPPHVVPLVEIISGERTDPAVAEAAYAFMEQVGQAPILCRKDVFGFVINRIQMALVREALYLYREGIASAADIDRCVMQGLGLRWAFLGPFGIEHTNSASIEDDLRKFGPVLKALFDDVCRPYDGPSEEDITRAAADVERMFGGRPQPEIVDYRNRMVLATRALKRDLDPYV